MQKPISEKPVASKITGRVYPAQVLKPQLWGLK